MVGIGAALSTTLGGLLIQRISYRASFLGLSVVALIAFAVLWGVIPETLSHAVGTTTDGKPGTITVRRGFGVIRTMRTQFHSKAFTRAEVATACVSHNRSLLHNWHRQARNEDYMVALWSEHGTPGAQSGPNKNGRKS
jgi:MFS family permease